MNQINEPLQTGPGPFFKVTCNVRNQLPESVPACSEVNKNKLLLAQTAGFSSLLHHQTLTALVEDWLERWTEVASNIDIYNIYHLYGYWKKGDEIIPFILKISSFPNYIYLLLSSAKLPRLSCVRIHTGLYKFFLPKQVVW